MLLSDALPEPALFQELFDHILNLDKWHFLQLVCPFVPAALHASILIAY